METLILFALGWLLTGVIGVYRIIRFMGGSPHCGIGRLLIVGVPLGVITLCFILFLSACCYFDIDGDNGPP